MSTTPEPQLDELTRLMREFSKERDWKEFHEPTIRVDPVRTLYIQ